MLELGGMLFDEIVLFPATFSSDERSFTSWNAEKNNMKCKNYKLIIKLILTTDKIYFY